MATAAIVIAAPRFYGEWSAGLWIAIGAVTVVTVAIALVLNRL